MKVKKNILVQRAGHMDDQKKDYTCPAGKQVEILEETTKEVDDLSPIGLMIPESVLQNAARIIVWVQTFDIENKTVHPWSALMEFPISKAQKERFANIKPLIAGLYISCESDL